jgi:mannose-1-phosphate guanylyltransferase/mannose-6-phosphate isomerase
MLIPVILSGGTGSRLWPLSRELHPKQYLSLVGDQSLLQNTVLRLESIVDAAPPIVVCNEEQRFMVAEQLRRIGVEPAAVILEPIGRNTAPAVTIAALHAVVAGEDPTLLVLPADHVIVDGGEFRQALEQVVPYAQSGCFVTFGIVPQGPEIGYGYIKAGEPVAEGSVCRVERFVEKPDIVTARAYIDSGQFYWNSGMFMFRASRFLEELERLAPEICAACRQAYAAGHLDLDFLRLDKTAFEACPSDSIDYALMEKVTNTVVIPLDAGWSDVGSWAALWRVGKQDQDGNVINGDVLVMDTHDSYLYSGGRLVATIGVDDLVVVETADAVLVARKDRVEEVKAIVSRLKAGAREECYSHRRVYRPWGAYESIEDASRFQVKHITVNPGASLSLQMHHHRAEHWIVVSGTARVTRGDKVFLLSENQSTYIPLGTQHRLENPGKIPLELIEVQSGSYLGEDDIVRFQDAYGRQDVSLE